MFGFGITDIVVLIAYLLGITLLGVWTARKVHGDQDFFMPRRFGKLLMLTHAFGTGTHSDQAVSVAAKTYSVGLSGIWYQWLWLFCTPFYWLIAPMMRRFRAVTTADIFEARFGRSVAMLFACVGMFDLSVKIGTMLKGSGAVIAATLAGAGEDAIHYEAWVIAIITVLFVAYGVAGGLGAAIVTDFVQSVLTVVFSFMLLPVLLDAVGGLNKLRETINDESMFSLVAPAEIGVFYILVIAVNALVGIVTQPHTLGNCAAGRTEFDGRFGWVAGNFVKRVCTVAWTLTGLAAVAYFAGQQISPDHIYGAVARDFLPAILPGLLGVFVAALLASIMSSCDSFMISSSALFTENIYRVAAPGRNKRHYLKVGRIAALGVVGVGVFLAFQFDSVLDALELFWKISAMMGIAFWMGVVWRGATAAGAWAATLGAFVVLWMTGQAWFIGWIGSLPFAEDLRLILMKGGEPTIYLPWQMIMYLTTGLVLGVVVSWLTPKPDKEKLDNYYTLIATPVAPGEPEPEQRCTLPEGVEPRPVRRLLPIPGIQLLRPNAMSVGGFVVCWIIVAALIASVVWIARA